MIRCDWAMCGAVMSGYAMFGDLRQGTVPFLFFSYFMVGLDDVRCCWVLLSGVCPSRVRRGKVVQGKEVSFIRFQGREMWGEVE